MVQRYSGDRLKRLQSKLQYGGRVLDSSYHNGNFGHIYNQGVGYQRGRGLGNIFGSLFRMVQPLFKSGLKTIGRQLLSTGAQVLDDYDQQPGGNFKEILKARGKEGISALTNKASEKFQQMGSGSNSPYRYLRNPINRWGPGNAIQFSNFPQTRSVLDSSTKKRAVKRSHRRVSKSKIPAKSSKRKKRSSNSSTKTKRPKISKKNRLPDIFG